MFQYITRVRKMETCNSQKKTLSHTAQYNKKCIPFQPDPCSTFLGALVMPCGGLTDCSLRFTCLALFPMYLYVYIIHVHMQGFIGGWGVGYLPSLSSSPLDFGQ